MSATRSELFVTAGIFFSAAILFGGPTAFAMLIRADAEPMIDPCAAVADVITAGEPLRAAALADSLWADPDNADCILSRSSMDRESFVALMDDLAANPTAARAYAQARNR